MLVLRGCVPNAALRVELVLEYKFFATPLPGYQNHSLFPPSEQVEVVGVDGQVRSTDDKPLWDPHRLMVYYHELQL